MNTHTITDNLVQKFLIDLVKRTKPETLGELLDELMKVEEYREARRRVAGPKIVSGQPKNRIGKIVVEMTGGTNPSNLMYQELANAGISTVLGMHMKEDAVQKANDSRLNIVIAGHISSDSLGMNLFLDELEKKGIEVLTCSGLIRVSRVKKQK
jgi:putative NIF3 family GTP cyclohydrolase 1 type 2